VHDAHAFAVRILSPREVVALAQCIMLDVEAFPHASLPFGVPGTRIWVARSSEHRHLPGSNNAAQVLGFVGGRVHGEAFYIHGLAVTGAARRQGVGRALVRACVARAAAERCSRIALHVGVANRAAVALYESEGFEVQRRARDFYRPGVYPDRDAYEMVLRSGPAHR
jgi:ribosomal protein S18 acetylase RimI-like enzyme